MKAKLLTRQLHHKRHRRRGTWNRMDHRWYRTSRASTIGWSLRYCQGHGVLFLPLGE